MYKNPHCALCNFINVTDVNFSCPTYKNCGRRTRFRHLPRSFSVLMDFSAKTCSKGEIYDPFEKNCQQVQCGSLYKLKRKRCVRKRNFEILGSSALNRSCLTKIVPEDEYSVIDEETVIVNSSGKIYRHGEYEFFNNTDLIVCNEKIKLLIGMVVVHRWTTLIVLSLSLICLGFHMMIYGLLPKQRNLPGRVLLCLSICLFIAHFLFLIENYLNRFKATCLVVGIFLHYFYLCSFCWTNAMSFDIYLTFRGNLLRAPESTGKTFKLYSLYSWGVPLVVVIASVTVEFTELLPSFKPHYAGQMCWIEGKNSLLLFFILPAGIICMENIILFIATAYGIHKQSKASEFAKQRSQSVKEREVSAVPKRSGMMVSKLKMSKSICQ